MPKLNEYLGSLVSSITNARVMSDIQSVKVAEEYAKHPLLQHFAIPRMRIDNVELTIPVALDAFEEKTETFYEPIDSKKFNTLAYKEVVNVVGVSKLSVELSRILSSEIANKTVLLEQEIKITKNLDPLKSYTQSILISLLKQSDKFTAIITEAQKRIDFEKVQINTNNLLSKILKIASEKKIIENLNVIVEADKLREKKPESLVYIKMKISEEGMEWHKMENSKGEIEKKLLPE